MIRRGPTALQISLALLLVIMAAIAGGMGLVAAQATGGKINSINKFAIPGQVNPGDPVSVNVSINALPCVPPFSVSAALVIDKSGSMAGAPLLRAREAAALFVDTLDLSQDRASVVAFSGDGNDSNSANDAQTLIGLSQDRNALQNAIRSITVERNTNIYEGLRQGGATLASAPAADARALILLTDGEANIGQSGRLGPAAAQDALNIATTLKNQGIRIYTIGLGRVDDAFLRNIASSPAQYYSSPGPGDLPQIYAQIARTLLADIGTNAKFVEKYDNVNFEIIPGSQIPSSGVVDPVAGTITWDFSTLGSRQSISYQVRAKTNLGAFNVSQQTSITYTQATGCPEQGQAQAFTFGPGAGVIIDTNLIIQPKPADITIIIRAEPNATVARNDVVTYTIVVVNRGEGRARETILTLPFDPAVAAVLDARFDRPTGWVSQLNNDSIEIRTGPMGGNGDTMSATVRFRTLGNVASGTSLRTQGNFRWVDDVVGGAGNTNTVTLTISDSSSAVPFLPLTAEPFSGPAGSDHIFRSGAFAPNEPVALWYNTPNGNAVAVGRVIADANGQVTASFRTTGLTAGNYSMVAYGLWTEFTALGIFQVQ